ncbi:hypothetical protein Bbelb_358120 [Branchiostoma belcheri]|nr:hypothetical protein Bbelb_358120 [Branchiostoma belcheri]
MKHLHDCSLRRHVFPHPHETARMSGKTSRKVGLTGPKVRLTGPKVSRPRIQDKTLTRQQQTGDPAQDVMNAYQLWAVRVRPAVLVYPENVTIAWKETATFKCQATGNPPPAIFWYKEGSQNRVFWTTASAHQNDHAWKLSRNFRAVETTENWFNKSAIYNFRAPPVYKHPTLSRDCREVKSCVFNLGDAPCLALVCRGRDCGATKILHFPGKTAGRLRVSNSGELIIRRVSNEDQGWYVCKALSVSGSVTGKTYLRVDDSNRTACEEMVIPMRVDLPYSLTLTDSNRTAYSNRTACEEMVIPMCVDLPYSLTSYPNFLGHASQAAASAEIMRFHPLAKMPCSPDILSFICTLYAPPCDKKASFPD